MFPLRCRIYRFSSFIVKQQKLKSQQALRQYFASPSEVTGSTGVDHEIRLLKWYWLYFGFKIQYMVVKWLIQIRWITPALSKAWSELPCERWIRGPAPSLLVSCLLAVAFWLLELVLRCPRWILDQPVGQGECQTLVLLVFCLSLCPLLFPLSVRLFRA